MDSKIKLTYLSVTISGMSLLASYGIIRPISNSLFLSYLKAEDMFWGMAILPILVTLLMFPYGFLLERSGPLKTVWLTTLLSLLLLIFPFFIRKKETVFILYIWKDAFIVLLLEQFWAFVNSIATVDKGKRFYGYLLLLGSIGAIMGNQAVANFVESIGSWNLYLIGSLIVSLFIIPLHIAYRLAKSPRISIDRDKRIKSLSGVSLFFKNPYLITIAGLVTMDQIVVATLDVSFHHTLSTAFLSQDHLSSFEGRFWSWVNGGSLFLQLITPSILKVVDIRWIHLFIPLTQLLTIGSTLIYPTLITSSIAFAWIKIVDYSIFKASKEILYIPLDFDSRYKAKLLIDMVIYRATKGLTGLSFSLITKLVLKVAPILSPIALISSILWCIVGEKAGREFRKIS